MADTVITNTPTPSNDSSAGWMVAVLILIVIIGGSIYAYRKGMFGSRAAPDTTNINLTIPNPIDGGTDGNPTQ